MFVMGGYDGSSRLNDVWSSSDGSTWNLLTGTAGWSARNAHTSVVYDNQMFVMGGYDRSTRLNDVWSMGLVSDSTSIVTSESSVETKAIGAVWIVGHLAVLGYAALK